MKTRRFFGQVLVLLLLATLSKPVESSKENQQVGPTMMAAMNIYRNGAYDAVPNTSSQSSQASATTFTDTGNTIYAASCSQADVQSAIDSAVDEDTVVIPSGNSTWTSSVSISGKKITLQGAGIGETVIALGAIRAVGIGTSGSRVTGFEFNISSTSGKGVSAAGTGWRVDHCEFDFRTAGGKGIGVDASGRNLYYPTWELSGLVDNCVFYDGRNLASGSAVPGVSDPTKAWAIWSAPTDLGGPSAVYFEDNTFYLERFGNLMDGNYGGVYVFRFNTISKGPYSGSVIEAHSLQCECRGFKKWEIYGNTIFGSDCWVPFFLRGGTGVIFNNVVTGEWNSKQITMDNVRSFKGVGPGLCDGTSSWDGNEGTGDEAGYPCRDQIGRGADSYSWPSSAPYPSQPLKPVYAYGNTPSDVTVSVNSNSAHHIKANRDYYDYTASFDGTSGVGVGTLADQPSICIPGVAYWATDQGNWNQNGDDGVLYKCTSTNNWELYYTPYTYPHPLRGGSGPDTTPPTCSNGSPTGTLTSGTTQATISLTTNETATCRYSTTPGTAYTSMTNTFSTTGETSHSTTVSGLSDGNSYAYYVRCQDTSGNANPDDYPITFSIAEPLVLHGTPADQAIHLTWTVTDALPITSTWRIAYDGPTGDQTSPINDIISPTRAYTLTGLTNYTWYTVTLNAMSGSASLLADTVRVMPTGIFVYLPIVLKGPR